MTDHDQLSLELLYERRKATYLRRMLIGLVLALLASLTNNAIHAVWHGRDLAELAAKCGPERP